jgi:hypothetical protein
MTTGMVTARKSLTFADGQSGFECDAVGPSTKSKGFGDAAMTSTTMSVDGDRRRKACSPTGCGTPR